MVKNTFAERPKTRDARALAKQEIAVRLNEFVGLGRNWDGDDADAVSAVALELARSVGDELVDLGIKVDFCIPLRNGDIQFEFEQKGDCELEVYPNQELWLLRYDAAANLVSKEKTTLEQLKNHVRK